MNIIENIKTNYGTFGRVQKSIADYVLEYPEKVCFFSIRDFAKELNTTEVTVFRFLNKIGYHSYNDFKKELQNQIRSWLSPKRQISQAVSQIDKNDFNGLFQRIARSEADVLKHTYAITSIDSLRYAVDMIAKAKKVYVVGHEVSESIAKFLIVRLNQLNRAVEYVNVYDLEVSAPVLANVDRESSVFIVISFPIYSKGTLVLTKYLIKKQIKYISVTDKHSSEIAVGAAVSLVCNSDDVIFYNSITSAVSMINMICSLLAVSLHVQPDSDRDHIDQRERIDQVLQELKSDFESGIS